MNVPVPSNPQDVPFAAFGVCGRVRVSDTQTIEAVHGVLPPGTELGVEVAGEPDLSFALSTSSDGRYGVEAAGRTLAEGLPLTLALGVLERELTNAVALRAPGVIFVHAGVVARRGRALVLPGSSFVGKSSLVAELVRAGARYYSDEYAVIDSEGRVLPYARPLSMRSGLEQETRTVSSLGGRAGHDPADVVAVIITEYRKGAAWEPRPLSEGQAVLAMLSNTLPAQARPAESLRAVTRAVEGARLLHGARPDAKLVAEHMLEQLD